MAQKILIVGAGADSKDALLLAKLKENHEGNNANTLLAVVHSIEREKELQELCVKVINTNPNRYYNPNGADETTCPFCNAKDYSNDCTADIEDIKHETNCAYNIALGLSTNNR